MPITTYHPSSRAHRHEACTDPVIGAVLSGWRYDISGIPKDLRGDYEAHLRGCNHCRRRQRLHRVVDVLLLAVTTLSFATCLLASLVMHRLEVIGHISNVHHLHLHGESAALTHIPASISISLQAVAIAGVFVSMVLWILVAIATPIPTMLSTMLRERHSHGEDDGARKQAA